MKIYQDTALWAIGIAGIIGISSLTSRMNCQGAEYLTGKLVEKKPGCEELVDKLGAATFYKNRCSYTVKIDTVEGQYTIGVLGRMRGDLQENSEVEFTKKSTRYVTSFNENRMGLLSAEFIKKR